jgi:hypothetical protein
MVRIVEGLRKEARRGPPREIPRYDPMAGMLQHLNGLLDLLRNRVAQDSDAVRQVRLSKDRTAYLRLGALRDRNYGYRGAEVTLEPPASEKAAVASLVALEGRKLDPRLLLRRGSVSTSFGKA